MFEAYELIFNRRGQAYHRAMQLVPVPVVANSWPHLNMFACGAAEWFATCRPVAATWPIFFRPISSSV